MLLNVVFILKILRPLFLLPVPLGSLRWSQIPQSRFDMGYESYDILPSFYDSMIGKVITLGENRDQALSKMNFILKK